MSADDKREAPAPSGWDDQVWVLFWCRFWLVDRAAFLHFVRQLARGEELKLDALLEVAGPRAISQTPRAVVAGVDWQHGGLRNLDTLTPLEARDYCTRHNML